MRKYTAKEALAVIGLSENELECLIRTGKKLSKVSATSAGQPNLELVFVEDGGYYNVGKYCDLYPAEDEVLIKPILLDEEIDGMKKNSGWIVNLGNVDDKKASIPEVAKEYFFSNQGLVGYPSKIEGKSAKAINEFLHRGHLMAEVIISKFINPRTGEKMYASERQRHNVYPQFKQSNCHFTDGGTRKGQSYFEKKIVDYLKSEDGFVNYEVRALFKSPSDKVPRANLLCARFYDSCGEPCCKESFCVVIPNMGSQKEGNSATPDDKSSEKGNSAIPDDKSSEKSYSVMVGYRFSYEDGLEKCSWSYKA